jgi:hypothetical protein
MNTSTLSICFVDFLYPIACFEKRWAIVEILTNSIQKYTGILPNFKCIPSDTVFGKVIDLKNPNINNITDCIVVTGIESSSSTQIADTSLFIIGPAYNYSRDFVLPYQTNEMVIRGGDGWGFVNPLDWTVWAMMLLVITVAIGVQVLMKKIEVVVIHMHYLNIGFGSLAQRFF